MDLENADNSRVRRWCPEYAIAATKCTCWDNYMRRTGGEVPEISGCGTDEAAFALRRHPLNLSGRFIQIAFHCISDICKVSLTFWHFLTTELVTKWFRRALLQVLFRCAMEFSILILHRNSPRPFMPSPRATSSVFGWLDVVRQLKTWTIFGDEIISEKLGKLLICSSTLTHITAGDDLTSSPRDPVTSSFGPPTVCCKASSKAFTYQRIGNGWDNVELVMSFGGKWEASWGMPQAHLTSSNHTQHMMWPTSLIGPQNKKPAVSNLLHDCFSTLAENSRQVLQGNQQNQWLQWVKTKILSVNHLKTSVKSLLQRSILTISGMPNFLALSVPPNPGCLSFAAGKKTGCRGCSLMSQS